MAIVPGAGLAAGCAANTGNSLVSDMIAGSWANTQANASIVPVMTNIMEGFMSRTSSRQFAASDARYADIWRSLQRGRYNELRAAAGGMLLQWRSLRWVRRHWGSWARLLIAPRSVARPSRLIREGAPDV
jgi:hypothetical protein